MNMKLSILLAFCIASCKHIPEQSVSDTLGTSFCTEPAGDTLCSYNWLAPEPAAFYDINVSYGIHYKCPSVNPNNPNQFVCFKQDVNWPPKSYIITYDMSTEIEKVLFTFSGVMIGNLSWGKKDWIAFTQGPGTIRIFKSDGSNDRQIVESSAMNFSTGFGPEWSPDGNHLYYSTGDTNYPIAIICDVFGNTSGNPPIIPRPSWNRNNTLIGGGGGKVLTANISDRATRIIAEWQKQNEYDQIQSIEWLPDNRHAVFSKGRGLYRIDTHTGEILQMKDWCEMKNYSTLSVSDKGNFILCQKQVSWHTGATSARFRDEIWKMDINGCNEVRVLPRE
jgi:hypothetical protein